MLSKELRALEWINNEKNETRKNEMLKHFNNRTVDVSGWFGRVYELANARVHSNKVKVAKQGAIDNHIKMVVNGKIKYVSAESKTNGGRIDELLNNSKIKFVIYSMDFTQHHKAGKHTAERNEERIIEPVVIPKDLFVNKLYEFKAIKAINKNGSIDGLGIQVSSKKWYEWLKDYPVLFDREWTYETWEFEGLE